MSINESKKYPSYNNFPFEEIPDYQTNYADLQEWHKDIGEMLKKRTLNSIIEDYGKGKNSTRKKAEAAYEVRSYTDFFDYVICPRFALNLCAKFKKKCNQLDDDLESFFYNPDQANILLEDYETYTSKQRADGTKLSPDELKGLEKTIVDQVLSMFGMPHAETFKKRLSRKGYVYDAKSNQLLYQEVDDESVICALKLLNDLFFSGPLKARITIDKKKRLFGVYRLDGNGNCKIIAFLLRKAFSEDINQINAGEDYVSFKYKKASSAYQKDETSSFFIYNIISYILEQKRTFKEIHDTYEEYKELTTD